MSGKIRILDKLYRGTPCRSIYARVAEFVDCSDFRLVHAGEVIPNNDLKIGETNLVLHIHANVYVCPPIGRVYPSDDEVNEDHGEVDDDGSKDGGDQSTSRDKGDVGKGGGAADGGAASGGDTAHAAEERAAPAEMARAAPAAGALAAPAGQAAQADPEGAARRAGDAQAGGREGRAAAPADTAGDRYAISVDITVRPFEGGTFKVAGIQLGHETRELYARIAAIRGLQPEAIRLRTTGGVDLPNDGTRVGVTALAQSQHPTIHILHQRAAATTTSTAVAAEATDPTGTELGDMGGHGGSSSSEGGRAGNSGGGALADLGRINCIRVKSDLGHNFTINNTSLGITARALYESIAERCEGVTSADALTVIHSGRPLPNDNSELHTTTLGGSQMDKLGELHLVVLVRKRSSAA